MSSDPSAIAPVLIDLLSRNVGASEPLSLATDLVADLGLESIQVIEYLCAVEDHFDLAIDEDTLADVRTIGDLAAVVARLSPG